MKFREEANLFPLMDEGPAVVAELGGARVHRSCLHRWAAAGTHGVVLRTAAIGGTRHTTRRWLLQYWLDVAEQKAAAAGQRTRRRRKSSRMSPRSRRPRQ